MMNAIKSDGIHASLSSALQFIEQRAVSHYCCSQKGVVAALAQLLYGLGCNITESDQFSDTASDTFFQRIDFDYSGTHSLPYLLSPVKAFCVAVFAYRQ